MSSEPILNDNNEICSSFSFCDGNNDGYPFLRYEDYNCFDFDKTKGFVTHGPGRLGFSLADMYPTEAIFGLKTRGDLNNFQYQNLMQRLFDDIETRMMSAHKMITSNTFRKAHEPNEFIRLVYDDFDIVDINENRVRCVYLVTIPILTCSKIKMIDSFKYITSIMKILTDSSICPGSAKQVKSGAKQKSLKASRKG
jgi:hypothetical protein